MFNPDYIFVIDRSATVGGSVTAKEIFDNEIVKETDDYKNGRIVYLTSQVCSLVLPFFVF